MVAWPSANHSVYGLLWTIGCAETMPSALVANGLCVATAGGFFIALRPMAGSKAMHIITMESAGGVLDGWGVFTKAGFRSKAERAE